MVLVGPEFIINEDTVAVLPRFALQRQRDQISKSACGHSVLARKKPIIRFKSDVGPALHRFGYQMGTEPPRLGCRHRFREEDPDMSAITGAGTFEDGRYALSPARRQECQRIALPELLVEIGR